MNVQYLAVFLAVVALSHATPSKKRDGEFRNFPSGIDEGHSSDHHSSHHDSHHEEEFAEEGYGGEVVVADGAEDAYVDGFDPRLPDPPCVWTAWSSCSAECGGGSAFRNRRITDECSYGPESQTRPCNTNPCAQDCVLADWTEWGGGCCECSRPCGGGTRSRSRAVLSPALFGGVCLSPTLESEPCNTHPCPSDCILTGIWSVWSNCNAPCGGGSRTRSRSVDFVTVVRSGSSQSDAECPSSLEEEQCNTQACAIDCLVAEAWSEWSTCSATCGNGEQSRSREIVVFPQNGGENCPETKETRACIGDLPACPLDDPTDFKRIRITRKFPRNPIIIPPRQRPAPIFTTPRPRPTTAAPGPVDPRFCLNKPDGPYEHPNCGPCCNDLIMCFQRSPIQKWCPPGEVFIGRFRKCVPRASAKC